MYCWCLLRFICTLFFADPTKYSIAFTVSKNLYLFVCLQWIMAVGAQNDLGGTKLLPEKWLDALSFARKINRFFGPNLEVFSKKKGLHWNWDGFSVQIKVFSKKKGLHWNWDGFSPLVCPNKKTICPNFRRFEPNGGATAPQPPTATQ